MDSSFFQVMLWLVVALLCRSELRMIFFCRRCMCASSDTGVCVIVEFEDIGKNRVSIKQYRVTSKGEH